MSLPRLPLRVPLSSRTYIDKIDAGLTSIRGAQEIISAISSRRFVTKLILSHNDLGDDGCILLFKFLASGVGRKYQVAEISLNSNSIGNRGLLAISEYLQGNEVLKVLFLQNNRFTWDPETFASFTTAKSFFPFLDSPHLREIHLSAMDLTSRAAPHLIAYISSPQLLAVDLYSNNLAATASSDNTSEDDDDEESGGPASQDAWKASEAQMKRVLLRNAHLKRETEKDALRLLRYSRPLLLSSTGHASATSRCSDCSCGEAPPVAPLPSVTEASATQGFAFRALPTELQLYIMSLLAPTLSPAQRIRIYTFASSHATLPRAGSQCVLDPASMPFGVSAGGGCAGGKCAGSLNSVVCHKEQQRGEWLAVVGCSAYDPHRDSEEFGV
ncbi:hypothetical protein C8R46DRAFT_1122883 [Mycena filopes]|nr:hypothetical protein C8R46DRAFT_1122883 [Mycena filopes]